MPEHDSKTYAARDASTFVILGGFFAIISLPVLIGTIFGKTHIDRIINIVSGLIILVIGAGFIARGRWIHRKSNTGWTD